MAPTWDALISRQSTPLSRDARRMLRLSPDAEDSLRHLASDLRGREAAQVKGGVETVSDRRRALEHVIGNLKEVAASVSEARASSERKAEILLIIGGIVVLALPIVLTITTLVGVSLGWVSSLLNGLTAATFLGLMFGPGREIRSAAKDRTSLLLLPIGYEARVAAATTIAELTAVASDLDKTLRSLNQPIAS